MTEYNPIGGIPLVLGGNVFGWTSKGDDAYAVLDKFYEAGGRMIDTSDSYSRFAPGNSGGESETLLGQWIEDRGVRGDILLHTKTGNMPGDEVLTKESVAAGLAKSLDRLRTDYVDLYYIHFDKEDVSIEQIVASFDNVARTDAVRALGASNFKLDRLKKAHRVAQETGAMPFTVLQNQYNLLERDDFEPEYQAYCEEQGVAMLPYFGLASGYLTGKYRGLLDLRKSIRGVRAKNYLKVGPPVLKAMDQIAGETGASLPAIALAWLRRQPAIAAPIASARNAGQLDALIDSTRLELTEDQLARLGAAK